MVTVASTLGARALDIVVDNHHFTGQGQTLPLTKPRRQPGAVSVYTGDCLGLLLVVTLIVV
jgi:hypothetical protein